MSLAQAEVDKWLPLLKALQAYNKVGPVYGEEENAAVWDPVYYTVGYYGEARGLWDLPRSGLVPHRQSARAAGSPSQAQSSTGADNVGSMPLAPASATGLEAPRAAATSDEPMCSVPASHSMLETSTAGGVESSGLPHQALQPDGQHSGSASTRLTNLVGPASAAVGKPDGPADYVLSSGDEEEAAAEGYQDGNPAGPKVARVAASSGSASRPGGVRDGSADQAAVQANLFPSKAVSPLPESQALENLKELLAARCCHRVAASGTAYLSLGGASGATSGPQQDIDGDAEGPIAEDGGPCRLARLMDTDYGNDHCIVLKAARMFIIAVQRLDGFATKRVSGLQELFEARGDAMGIIAVLNGVGLATAAADALDVWSIAQLKQREASLGSRSDD